MPSHDPASPFSLLTPLRAAARAVRAQPAMVVLALLLFLIPVFPIAAGLQWVLRESGSAALESWIAGAPSGTPDALLTRPGAAGVAKLALTGLLVVTAAAALLAAGTAAVRAVKIDMRYAIAEWPVLLVGFVLQGIAGALLLTATLVAATGAGSIRFQLFDVVAVAGLIATLTVMARMSLWPSVAVTDRTGLLRAMGRSWLLTRRQSVRMLGSWLATCLAVFAPAVLLAVVTRIVLTALERAETIAWSPVVIDAVALVPLVAAIAVGVVTWSAGVSAIHPVLASAADDRGRDRSELSDAAAAGA